jgi:uncharacterized repeat protein (TIGR01451 family)
MKKSFLAILLLITFSAFAQEFNTVSGSIRIDSNNNGCSLSDTPAVSIPIKVMHGTELSSMTFGNEDGDYTVESPEETVTVMPEFNNPYYHVSPESFTCTFQGFGNSAIAGFCILPNGPHNDVEISIVPVSPARPGFDAFYKIVYKNKGTTTLDGNIIFNFNENQLDYVMSNPSGAGSYGAVNWSYTNLKPFESREITITLNVNSPQETPAVNIDDLLELSAHITPEVGDESYTDNHATHTQTVTGSFDPNEKSVSSASQSISNPFPLQYTIRFQNIGTAAAQNVVITDLLSDKLDTSSLQIVFLSHQCHITLADNKIEFLFENINLPAAAADESNSHGYVSFKVKPVSGIQAGDVVLNQAKIFFDFNLPIVTNSVSTVFYNQLAVDTFTKDGWAKCYPNPVKETLHVETAKAVNLESVSIFNALGQLLQTAAPTDFAKITTIDVSALKAGTYFIEMVSNQGKSTQKIIKG